MLFRAELVINFKSDHWTKCADTDHILRDYVISALEACLVIVLLNSTLIKWNLYKNIKWTFLFDMFNRLCYYSLSPMTYFVI